ncbi:DnaD-like helicase loader [Streptococcus phage APCM01]|uniref:DnaD-like helicase loader n=1 Tax=Streptococcus phage APCM01 TaxID=1647391 RepID=UPI00067A4CB1|nr:DnaD-like helicase loader [Streptococcus phage APCM01]AKI28582.1 replisome organizer [Streptococcus phage APCM01]
MAQRRMFSKKITETDKFLEMPLSSQALYFHLSMGADDEGFIDRAKTIQRTIGASDDDMKLLIAKGFLIPFESGVVIIRHWRIHNYIQADRFQRTIYQDEKSQLEYDSSKTAQLKPLEQCIQNVSKMDTQVRLEKDRLELDKNIYCRVSNETPTAFKNEKEKLNITAKTKEILEYLNSKLSTSYKSTSKKTQSLVKARLNEGYTVDDFKTVIDVKCDEWLNTSMNKYLRPETLFSNKFESYLNQPSKQQSIGFGIPGSSF